MMVHAETVEEAPAKTLHKVRHFTPSVVMADVATALVVGAAAAVPISIVDYSIMARVAGVTDSSLRELWRGTKTLFLRPHRFFLPCAENKCSLVFAVCFVVYTSTYIGSNTMKSYCEAKGCTPESANFAAGIMSGVANTITTVWKDGIILRSLPPVNAEMLANSKKPVPWLTRGLFCTRDTLTCLAAFTIAPMVANWLSRHCWNPAENAKKKLPEPVEGKVKIPLPTADMAQLLTPAALQFATTLLHITAIRYHQTYPKFSMGDLQSSLRDTYLSSTMLRVVRILPSFGVGAILNRELRSDLLDRAEGPTA
ncbi:hypothetical protein C3747_61g217 [Trypanosoma cruzi]|uniref:Mitochondrial carrier protein n=2 Tax=Trypanosoma cruzi TaxID=5693 RepID=Q4D9H2_TRYCC|nr:hypothetical protein, conserved [Trypanosoma cruzi]EAN89167.1 hypothetical protein, conserved [Trypanosoma cruzi]PWV11243.1 hypothetical protein C3747_61g217 [Trypanosoma cruzi]|eukprot:XP_811018.1 hypothetical protein [Trypanosoma cruzi strain CL Brener]